MDIRACFFPTKQQPAGEWIVHHGVAPGYPIQTILTDVQKFLDEHLTEVVLVEISHFSQCTPTAASAQQMASLTQMVKSVFGARLVPKATGLSSTVAQLVAQETRAFVAVVGATETDVFSDDVFANNYANTPDLNKMIAHNTALAAKLKTQSVANSNKLTKMSWTLTPDEKTITDGLTSCVQGKSKVHNLLQLAHTSSMPFVKWFKQLSATRNAAQMPMVANVVLFDSPTHQQVATVLGKPQ